MSQFPFFRQNIFSALVLLSITSVAVAAEKNVPPPPAVEVKSILQTNKGWDGSKLPGFTPGQTEMRMQLFKIAPGAKTSVHLHPVNGAGYVLSGELTMYATSDLHGNFSDKSKVREITLKAGEVWAEAVNTWHYGVNKGNVEAQFLVVFAGTEGTPSTLSLSGLEAPLAP